MTLREAISQVKKGFREVNSDSRLPNKLIYSKLISKTSLVIQRESDALRIGNLQDLFQTVRCITMKEVPAIDKYCNIHSDLTIYRSCNKLPDLYSDLNGVIIKSIRTVDRGKIILLESLNYIINKKADTNSKYDKNIYAFYEDGYLYMEKKVPIKVEGMFSFDISRYKDCDCGEEDKPCARFLDSKWFVPKKLEDAIIALVIQDLGNSYERIPAKQVMDKNENT